MTRNSVLIRFRSAIPIGSRPAGIIDVLRIGLVLALAAGWTPTVRASGIFRDLTARDRSQPILLSATGAEISMANPGHASSAASSGKVPAYLAFPLDGGEHLPAHIPTIATGPQPAEGAVGPLSLTPAVQGPLNADLIASHGAIVDAPGGSYAVAMLPRYARALAQATSSAGGGGSATSTLASMLGLNPKANWTVLGVSTNELSQWYKDGTKELSKLTSTGTASVSKSLGVKVTPTTDGVNVEAQYLPPPALASPAATPSASASVATPEPSGWLVFGLILGGAGLWRRAR
jgi:hypothetical protein